MFNSAIRFTGDISGWNVSEVRDMSQMFQNPGNLDGTMKFNSDLSDWDVSKVERMDYMFNEARNFNMDLSRWNISKVTGMAKMFINATSFQQNLCPWKNIVQNVVISQVLRFNIFYGSACPKPGNPNINVGPWCYKC